MYRVCIHNRVCMYRVCIGSVCIGFLHVWCVCMHELCICMGCAHAKDDVCMQVRIAMYNSTVEHHMYTLPFTYLGPECNLHGISELLNTTQHRGTAVHTKHEIFGCIVAFLKCIKHLLREGTMVVAAACDNALCVEIVLDTDDRWRLHEHTV